MAWRSAFVFALTLALAVACEHDPELDRVGGPLPDGSPSVDAGTDGPSCPPIDPSIVTPALPCEIEDILIAKCQRCHSDPQQNNAPFPLLTWSDTQQDYGGKPIYERAYAAVSAGLMPYTVLKLDPPVQPLTADEKTKLLAWLADCAPPIESVVCP